MSSDEHINKSEEKLILAGLALIFVSATIGFATTTLSSRAAIETIRLFSLATSTALMIYHLFAAQRIEKRLIFSFYLLFFFLSYGTGISLINNSYSVISETIARDAVAITLMTYYLNVSGRLFGSPFPELMAKLVCWYVGALLVLTILADGLVLTYPPHFINDYLSEERGSSVHYSQGLSKIFALSAISAFYVFARESKVKRFFWLYLSIPFLLLSFLGGARGDSVAGLLVISLIALRIAPALSIISIVGLLSITFLLDLSSLQNDDFVILRRFTALGDATQVRGDLLADSIKLLSYRLDCLTVGCGFGYFQFHFGYHPGLYPHNSIIEFIISVGLLLFIPIFSLAAYGIFKQCIATKDFNYFLLIFIYFFIISLKSGSVLSGWIVLAGTFYYASFTLISVHKFISSIQTAPENFNSKRQ